MIPRHLILILIFTLTHSRCAAQDRTEKQQTEPVNVKIGTVSPYYVLKVGDKSVGIDTKVDTSFDLKSINPDGIKEVNVLKDASAISLYGDKGINGVVIIVFKDSYILPKNLQAKFDEVK